MDHVRGRERLARADRHIAQIKLHIERQHELVRRAIQSGRSPELAESMLRVLEQSLRAFERHRELIADELVRDSVYDEHIRLRASAPIRRASDSNLAMPPRRGGAGSSD